MPSSFILSLMLNLLLLSTAHKHHNSKIILINAHYKKYMCTTTLYIHVNPLTCVVVVLFLSFLFKVFAVYCGKSRKVTSGVQMNTCTLMIYSE